MSINFAQTKEVSKSFLSSATRMRHHDPFNDSFKLQVAAVKRRAIERKAQHPPSRQCCSPTDHQAWCPGGAVKLVKMQ